LVPVKVEAAASAALQPPMTEEMALAAVHPLEARHQCRHLPEVGFEPMTAPRGRT
jgi:hypothetical protein